MPFLPIERPVERFPALLDLCRTRLDAARRRDPGLSLEVAPGVVVDGQRRVAASIERWVPYTQLARYGLLLATLVTALFTWGPVLWVLGGVTVAAALAARWGVRRHSEPMQRWHSEAQVLAAAVVQADDSLFGPAEVGEDCEQGGPGVLLVTFDEGLARDPRRLCELAARLFELKTRDESTLGEPERALRRFLWEELAGTAGLRRVEVPPALAGAPRTYLVEVSYLRSAMPEGFLHRRLWLALGRERAESVVLAPLELWWHPAHDALLERAAEGPGAEFETELGAGLEPTAPQPVRAGAGTPSAAEAEAEAEAQVPAASPPDPRALSELLGHLQGLRPPPPAPSNLGQRLRLGAILWGARLALLVTLPATVLVVLRLEAWLQRVDPFAQSGFVLVAWVWVVTIVAASVRSLRGLPRSEGGPVALERAEHPALFGLLDGLARLAGVPAPERVRTGWAADMRVFEERGGGLLARRTRTLVLDVRDVCGFTLAECTGLLAHELAHLRGDHTGHGSRLWRASRWLYELDAAFTGPGSSLNPMCWIVRGARALFERCERSTRREHERAADRFALAAVGPRAWASALAKLARQAAREQLRLPELFLGPPLDEQEVLRRLAELRRPAPDDPRAEAERRLERALLERPTQAHDSHPAYSERIAAALAAEVELEPPSAALAPVRALEVLLGARRPEVERAVAADFLALRRRWRETTPALRGVELTAGELATPAPPVRARRWSTDLWLAFLSLPLVLFALNVSALVSGREDGWGELVGAALALGLLVVVGRARAIGLAAESDALARCTLFGTRRWPWAEVVALRSEPHDHRVQVQDGHRARWLVVPGPEPDARLLAEAVLERAPSLRTLAWGTGLSRAGRVAAPDGLPQFVRERPEGISLEGPGPTRLHYPVDDPAYAAVRAAVRERLIPLLDRQVQAAHATGPWG